MQPNRIHTANRSGGLNAQGVAWHALPETEVAKRLEASPDGLTDTQVLARYVSGVEGGTQRREFAAVA